MAENIYFDLSEEIEQDLIQTYEELCSELTGKLNSMVVELEELCKKTKYEPMVKVVNDTVHLFDDKIYQVANQTFEEWLGGSGSFSAASENSKAGEEALGTARAIEQNIKGEFEGFWSSHPMGEVIQIDTSRPNVKSEDFEKMKDIYTRFSGDVESLGDNTVNKISEQGEDNPTYNVIIPAVKAITEPLKNAFEQFGTKIDDAKNASEILKQQQDQNNEGAADAATQTSASAAEIADALKMFDNV